MKRLRGVVTTLGITGLAAGCVAPAPLAPSWGLGAIQADEGYDLLAAPAPCASRPLAIYARSASTPVVFAGSRHTVNGDLYTNDALKLAGTTHRIQGQAATADGVVYAGNGSTVGATKAASGLPVPVTTDIAGRAATFNFPGDVNLDAVAGVWATKTTLKPGLYRTGGVLSVSRSGLAGTVTFQAREVRIHSVNAQLKAFTAGILVLGGAGGAKVTGTGGRFDGTILAPGGPVAIAGAGHGFRGIIVGDTVSVDGTAHMFTGMGPRDCPTPEPIRRPTPAPVRTPIPVPTPTPRTPVVTQIDTWTDWQCYGGESMAVDESGALYYFRSTFKLFKRTPGGVITQVAGTGVQGNADGALLKAGFYDVTTMVLGPGARVYAGDYFDHTIRLIDFATGQTSTVAGVHRGPQKDGYSYWNVNREVLDIEGITSDKAGRYLYVVEPSKSWVRRVDLATGELSVVAGDNSQGENWVDGTAAVARFSRPNSITSDPAGNLYVADTFNQAIRKIDMRDPARPIVSTLAGDASNGVPVSNRLVSREVPGAFRDGVGRDARFNSPTSIAYDAASNPPALYVADWGNNRVRKISLADPTRPVVTTVVGTGVAGCQDGPAATAQLDGPREVAARAGVVYVMDKCSVKMIR